MNGMFIDNRCFVHTIVVIIQAEAQYLLSIPAEEHAANDLQNHAFHRIVTKI